MTQYEEREMRIAASAADTTRYEGPDHGRHQSPEIRAARMSFLASLSPAERAEEIAVTHAVAMFTAMSRKARDIGD